MYKVPTVLKILILLILQYAPGVELASLIWDEGEEAQVC